MKKVLVLILIILMLSGTGCSKKNERPDCIGSISFNDEVYLTIVANRNQIEDEEDFAKELFEMCEQNSFQSLRLSTDINGFPKQIKMKVYLDEYLLEEGPIMTIKFCRTTLDFEPDDMWYELYIDGKKKFKIRY